MTREEFFEMCTSFGELVDFCNEEDLDELIEDVYSDGALDDYLNDYYYERMSNGSSWYEIRDEMNDVPTGYDWYIMDYNYGEIIGCGDCEFEDLQNRIVERMDEDELWDEPEPESEEPEYEEPCVPDEEAEEVDIGELISLNQTFIITATKKKEEPEAEPEDEEDLSELLCETSTDNLAL